MDKKWKTDKSCNRMTLQTRIWHMTLFSGQKTQSMERFNCFSKKELVWVKSKVESTPNWSTGTHTLQIRFCHSAYIIVIHDQLLQTEEYCCKISRTTE
jgi:hypothetical protein